LSLSSETVDRSLDDGGFRQTGDSSQPFNFRDNDRVCDLESHGDL
jgi:hypothetical protein